MTEVSIHSERIVFILEKHPTSLHIFSLANPKQDTIEEKGFVFGSNRYKVLRLRKFPPYYECTKQYYCIDWLRDFHLNILQSLVRNEKTKREWGILKI